MTCLIISDVRTLEIIDIFHTMSIYLGHAIVDAVGQIA